MIENSSLQNLHSESNNKLIAPQSLSIQPLALTEEEEDELDLGDFFNILKRRALVIAGVAGITMAGVVGFTLSREPQYEDNFRLLVEPVDEDNNNNLSELTSFLNTNIQKSGLDYESQIEVLQSPELMRPIINDLQVQYPDITYKSLLKEEKNLKITRLGETKVIEVTYRHSNPTQVKEVLDKIAQAYLKYSLERRQTQLSQGIRFVDKELPPIKEQVEVLQQQLQTFRQQYDFFDPNTQSSQIIEQLKLLSGERQKVDQQLAKAKAELTILQQEEGAPAILKDAPVYQQLITQIRNLEAQIAGESTRFQDKVPTLKRLKEKRQKLLPLLEQEKERILKLTLSEAANRVQALEVQSQKLSAAEEELSQKVKQLPSLARRYTELQQKLLIANESFNRFLKTRQDLKIEAAQTELPWEIIKAPVTPEDPVSPKILLNLILGVVASTFLGIGAALIREKLDNTYHNVDALKDDLKLPLLGALPIDKSLESNQKRSAKAKSSHNSQADSISQSRARSYFQDSGQFLEALRVVHTNLQMLSSDRQIRSIVISSALPGDGKSTVAYNLAQVAASMGQQVLLIDTDLRRPQVHARTGLRNFSGLSNLISGNMSAEQVMQQLPNIAGCSVITSGPIPPDATRLLSSGKMKQLIKEFHEKFDLVIYDAPPLFGLADASILAPHTDGIMLVVRIDKTERSIIKQAVESLKISRTNILGVVANGDKSIFHKYYHKYYHS